MRTIIQKFKNELPPLLYLITLMVPLYGSPDRAITQWVYISLVNLFLLFFIKTTKSELRQILHHPIFLIYSIYILSLFLSIFSAYNKSEALVEILRTINIYFGFFLLCNHFIKQKNITIFIIGLLILYLLQNLKVFIVVFSLFDFTSISLDIANRLTGFTMNKNISAYFILFNLPLLTFLFLKSNQIIFRILIAISLTFGLINLLIYGTRSAMICLIIISFLLILYHIFLSKVNFINIFSFTIIVLSSYFYVQINNSDKLIIKRMETLNLEDSSVNKRISYYKGAFNTMLENPFLGIGVGNWKIYSVNEVKDSIKNYIAPYHVHNDFLQKGAEGGFFGFLSYIILIFTPIFLLLKKFLENKNEKYFILIASFIIYIIDSSFNFPYSRPIIQVYLMIMLSLTLIFTLKKELNEDT